MKLVVYMPAFNEAENIETVLDRIPKEIARIDEIVTLVVDDGSTDNTIQKAKKCRAFVVSHGENRGVGAAFQTAVNWALENSVDILVSIDADGQFDPKEMPKLIEPILNGEADFVTGSRFSLNKRIPNMSKMRLWGNKQMSHLINFCTKRKLSDVSCGYRAYSVEALLNLNLFGAFTYTQETILDLSFKKCRIKEIPVSVEYHTNRNSRVANNLVHYAYQTIKIILRTVRDYKPLKVFGSVGLFILVIGLGFDAFVLNYYISTGKVSPHKLWGFLGGFLNTIGLFIIALGVLAEMFERIRRNQESLLYFEKRKQYEKRKAALASALFNVRFRK